MVIVPIAFDSLGARGSSCPEGPRGNLNKKG